VGGFDLVEIQVLESEVDVGTGIATLMELDGDGVLAGFQMLVGHNELPTVGGATVGTAVHHVSAFALVGEVETTVVESFDAFPVDVDNGCVIVAQRTAQDGV